MHAATSRTSAIPYARIARSPSTPGGARDSGGDPRGAGGAHHRARPGAAGGLQGGGGGGPRAPHGGRPAAPPRLGGAGAGGEKGGAPLPAPPRWGPRAGR